MRIKQSLETESKKKSDITYRNIAPSAVKDIFTKIPGEDQRFLGFNYPEIKAEYMILQDIPVPPICVRPSVMLPGSTTSSQDDITFALSNILKANITYMGDVRFFILLSSSLFSLLSLLSLLSLIETPRKGKQGNGQQPRNAPSLLQQLL